MKISHIESKVIDWVVSEIEQKFVKMSVKRGQRHTFVGVDIYFNNDGTVTLSMEDYVSECIEKYKSELKNKAVTPAKGTLFDVDEGDDTINLTSDEADKYHHTTAKLLYLSKRVQIDINLAVSYLCTKVAKPTVHDKSKLLRVLLYLNGTRKMCRTMGMQGISCLQTWIDAS